MAYDRGERMKLNNSLTSRDKRRMYGQLAAAQEEIELAEEKRNKLLAKFWTEGLSMGAMQGATGEGYNTVRQTLIDQGMDVDPK